MSYVFSDEELEYIYTKAKVADKKPKEERGA